MRRRCLWMFSFVVATSSCDLGSHFRRVLHVNPSFFLQQPPSAMAARLALIDALRSSRFFCAALLMRFWLARYLAALSALSLARGTSFGASLARTSLTWATSCSCVSSESSMELSRFASLIRALNDEETRAGPPLGAAVLLL